MAFIWEGTRFGTRVLRYLEIAARVVRTLILRSRYYTVYRVTRRADDPTLSEMKFNEKPIAVFDPPSPVLIEFIHLITGRQARAAGETYYADRDTPSHRLIYLSPISTSHLTMHRLAEG